MNNELQKINSTNINVPTDILNSDEYKNLPKQTQEKLLELMIQKKIELTKEQQEYLLQHISSDIDTNQYLDYLQRQREIQSRSSGLTVSYNSYETKTPTGKISSKSSQTTVHSGCLLPILSVILVLSILTLL